MSEPSIFLHDDKDVNRGYVILTTGWIECAIAALFIVGRVYNRAQRRGTLAADDMLIVVSFMLALAFMAVSTPEVQYGTGRHLRYLSGDQAMQSVKLDWISQACHIMSTAVAKISIVLFIRQIIGHDHRKMWFLYGLVGMLFVISVVCVAVIFAQCAPAAALWDSRLAETAKCWDPRVQQGYGYFTASFSVFSDFALAIFPATILWNLQMEWRLKLSLMFFMGLGAFAGIASIMKTVKLKTLSSRGDYTYETVDLIIWMMTEQFCIIIAACIPPMRSLFFTIYRKVCDLNFFFQDATTSETEGGSSSKRRYSKHSLDEKEHADLSQLESAPWGNEMGMSATAYHGWGRSSMSSSSHTEVEGDIGGDNDDFMRGQHLVIHKRTELSVSEHRV